MPPVYNKSITLLFICIIITVNHTHLVLWKDNFCQKFVTDILLETSFEMKQLFLFELNSKKDYFHEYSVYFSILRVIMFKKESRSYRKIEMPGVEYGNTTVTELSILKCYASK